MHLIYFLMKFICFGVLCGVVDPQLLIHFSSKHAGFSIEGPSEARIDCADNGDGSATVVYWPTVPGEYAVHILCNEENIPKSPYMVPIMADTGKGDPNRVRLSKYVCT